MKLEDNEALMIYKKLLYADKGEWPKDSSVRLNILLKLEKEFPSVKLENLKYQAPFTSE